MFTVNNKSLISKYVQSQTDFSNMTNAAVYDNIMNNIDTVQRTTCRVDDLISISTEIELLRASFKLFFTKLQSNANPDTLYCGTDESSHNAT
tara:strand:+ start:18803 stop:19078 length:276 start_codon:yes stop_codon:yes gene_type:complete